MFKQILNLRHIGHKSSDDYSLDLKTLQQQSQDPVLRTVYSWLTRNEKPKFLTSLITVTLFLHAYYKRFSQLFVDDSRNLISLYTKNALPPETHPVSIPNIIRSNIRICFSFACLELSLTNFMNTLIQVSKHSIINFLNNIILLTLENGSPFLYTIAMNVNVTNTPI